MNAHLLPCLGNLVAKAAAGEEIVSIPNSDSPELGRTFPVNEGKMKKILIASTALALTAGMAAAESHTSVALSGSARMGVVYDGSDAAFSSRVRVSAAMSGTTDGGLSFGASMRFDQNGGNTDGKANGDSTVYLSGEFGKITMGDVGGAADALVGQVDGVGYEGTLDGLHEIGFIGTTKTAFYYEKSTAGGLTFGIGAGQVGSDELNVAVKYATDKFTVALGYEDDSTTGASHNRISASGSVTLGAATVKAKYSSDSAITDDAFAVSVSGTFGGVGVTAFYTDFATSQNIGLGAKYDLGGGASIVGGVVSVGATDTTVADLGLSFSF
jgi:outer membrane protein OmpU